MARLDPTGVSRILSYIKTWVTTALGGKANSSHNHTKSQITDFPTIPSKTSQLTNDSGFLTAHQSLSNYSTLANTVKSISISGKTITVTPGSGSAYTLTTQDTVYTHPTTAGNKHIPSGGSANQYLKYSASGTAVWANLPTIPSKTSQLTNDSGYITSSGSCNYANYSGYVQGNKSTGLYVESVKYGNALVTTNQSGFGAIFNAPTKNYRIGCATYPNNDDTLLFYSVTNANVSSSTNTVAKMMTWNGGTGILTATGFSGPLTGNVTGNCSGSSGSCTGNAANVTGTVAIGHGGTGATTRLGAVQNLTNENVGTSAEYFLTITTNWGKAGYCSVANAKSVLGIPTVNNATLTIQKNGTTVKTFTANASSNVTCNITVPTKTSELTNNSGFLTSHQSLGEYVKAARTNDKSEVVLCGGTNYNTGATLVLRGQNESTYPGNFDLNTYKDGVGRAGLVGNPDGSLYWGGQLIQYPSDQRLKQQISSIDDKLLDAWEDVSLVQYKYNDAVGRKGDNARLHTGYIVQQIDEACKSHNLDISAYGLYCYEEYPERTEEVTITNEDGTTSKETKVIEPAKEQYSLRYTEALIVECAYLRREVKRLSERLEKLEK